MIRRIPLTRRPVVMRRIAVIGGIERPRSERRPKPLFDQVDHATRRPDVEQIFGQAADREYLVRSNARVGSAGLEIGVDDVVEAPLSTRSRTARGTTAGPAVGIAPAAIKRAPILSALIQSACTSTGFPMRGVTTQSPTLASIQVSCTPGLPAQSRPSASARMPKRVPSGSR